MMKREETFYRRKTGLYILLVSVVCLVAANITGIYLARQDQKRNITESIAAETSLSKEAVSTNKAAAYISDSYALFQPNQKLLMTYIQRKFDIADLIPPELTSFNYALRLQNPEEMEYIYRIVDPNSLMDQPPKAVASEISRLTIASANCDRFPLPTNFWKSVDRQIVAGGYELTHIALALVLLRDNGCALPPIAATVEDRVVSGMLALADDAQTLADLRYESMVLLQMLGRHDLVKKDWINAVLAEQLPSGGWAAEANSTKESDHATVLAFWALLEYQYPESEEPLILRPSTPGQ